MKVTIEVDSASELERLSDFFEAFKIKTVDVVKSKTSQSLSKGDKKINPTGLFKIWEKQPRTLEEIRKASWERNASDK